MDDHQIIAAMQAFIHTVDSGSFSEGARRLGLSQPSVSRQVTALETHLGVRLLQRTTRRLSLTEAGQVYYDKARAIQRSLTEANQAISAYKATPSGELRIAAPYLWAETKIMPHMGEFLTRYPDIRLSLTCNDTIQDMVEDRLDLVLRVGHIADSRYVAVPLAPVRMRLCASPHYLATHGHPRSVSDLQNHNFIVFAQYAEYLFQRDNQQHSIRVQGSVVLNSVQAMIQCVKQHIGLALLPDLLINHEVDSGQLAVLMPDYHMDIKGLKVDQAFAMYSSRKQMPAKVRAFIDFYKTRFH